MSKSKAIASLVLVGFCFSASAMADGYRCKGGKLKVKMYNEVEPSRGTRNPAVMVVKHKNHGTLVRAIEQDIEKVIHEDTVVFEAHVNRVDTGRFVFAALEILKGPGGDYTKANTYFARLILNTEHRRKVVKMICKRYRKGDR